MTDNDAFPFRWFPFIGFRSVSNEEVEVLGLDAAFQWRVFAIEWLNFGLCFVLKPKP